MDMIILTITVIVVIGGAGALSLWAGSILFFTLNRDIIERYLKVYRYRNQWKKDE